MMGFWSEKIHQIAKYEYQLFKGKSLKLFNFENNSKSSLLKIFEASDFRELFPKTVVELIATLNI